MNLGGIRKWGQMRNECIQGIRKHQTKLEGILEYFKQDVKETETPIKGDALDILLGSTSISERRSAFKSGLATDTILFFSFKFDKEAVVGNVA
jgi:hypothetical protein